MMEFKISTLDAKISLMRNIYLHITVIPHKLLTKGNIDILQWRKLEENSNQMIEASVTNIGTNQHHRPPDVMHRGGGYNIVSLALLRKILKFNQEIKIKIKEHSGNNWSMILKKVSVSRKIKKS